MRNLLQETLEVLERYHKLPSDVQWVGSQSGDVATTWEKFVGVADYEYDSGYGGQEVAHDLVIVGIDWWLERGEYDGSEWWSFKKLPVRRNEPETLDIFTGYRGVNK